MTSDSQSSTRLKQLEIQQNCYHPDGSWEPFNWRNPSKTFPELIAIHTKLHPSRLALIDPSIELTYAELDLAANAVAAAILTRRGPGKEAVALLVGVDAQAIIAALGVLKAGKFYVALEETFPIQRHQQILIDAEVSLILSDKYNLNRARELALDGLSLIQLDALPEDASKFQIQTPSLDDLAILNYTSGTTGKPKGVAQSHRSALAQAGRFVSSYHVGAADRLALFHSLAWVDSFWDFIGGLSLGACIIPIDMRREGMDRLVAWLHKVEPTMVVGLTILREIEKNNPGVRFPTVRLVSTGGDTVYRRDVEAFRRIFPNANIALGFGLSEAGRVTEMFVDPGMRLDEEVLPLGFPVEGINIRLISPENTKASSDATVSTFKDVAIGEIGEVVIESQHLAVGYWRRPELTAEKFRLMEVNKGSRIYFTGDLARMRPDGFLQHMGRRDHVLKIRDLQVYPKEIEALLRVVPGVNEICIIGYTPPEENLRLVAYLDIDQTRFRGLESLYASLVHLPDYMKPQGWEFVDEMPRTPTGKIDRQRLPEPVHSRLNVSARYVPPGNPIEKILVGIWGEVLDIERIGVNDDFLEIGGDSITSTRIINLVRRAMNVELTFNDALNTHTIREMAEVIIKLHEKWESQ